MELDEEFDSEEFVDIADIQRRSGDRNVRFLEQTPSNARLEKGLV